MEQHPIPRQITTFEFKLIGFMTLRQFLYLVIFLPMGFVAYKLFPIPILNILVGIAVGSLGAAMAFVPINDRPLDVWMKNLYRRLTSATQYYYQKNNPPVALLGELYFVDDPHRVMSHIESQKKLASYLASTRQTMAANQKKQAIQGYMKHPTSVLKGMPASPKPAASAAPPAQPAPKAAAEVPAQPKSNGAQAAPAAAPPAVGGIKKPYFIGTIKNNRKIPLPGILIYVKDGSNNSVRLLKTNPHGIFATYNPMPAGEYLFEIKDPKGLYFFDTMKINIAGEETKPLEFFSKEML